MIFLSPLRLDWVTMSRFINAELIYSCIEKRPNFSSIADY